MAEDSDYFSADRAPRSAAARVAVRSPVIDAMSDEQRQRAVDSLVRLLVSQLEREQREVSEGGGSMQAAG